MKNMVGENLKTSITKMCFLDFLKDIIYLINWIRDKKNVASNEIFRDTLTREVAINRLSKSL